LRGALIGGNLVGSLCCLAATHNFGLVYCFLPVCWFSLFCPWPATSTFAAGALLRAEFKLAAVRSQPGPGVWLRRVQLAWSGETGYLQMRLPPLRLNALSSGPDRKNGT